MAHKAGRNAVLKKNTVAIAGVRMTSWKVDATPIDVTDKDDDGLQTLLSGDFASKVLSFHVEGVEDDQVLRDIAIDDAADPLLTDLTFEIQNSDIIGGNFFMTNYEEQNPHDGAQTFSADFTSSGAWTSS